VSETSGESEPPIREFADRGTLWLLEAPENLRGLVALVAESLADKLDFSRAERVNRSFIPDNLQKQEADILYRVPYRDSKGEVWVYVLLEHQSKPDKTMGLRLLSYMVELWRAQMRQYQDDKVPGSKWQLLPIIPIVFYTGKRKWKSGIDLKAMMQVPAELERFVPTWDTLFLNVQETPSEQLAQAQSAMAQVLRVLQVADAPKAELERVLNETVAALSLLFEKSSPEWKRALQYFFLLLHHKREPDDEEALREELIEAVDRILENKEGEEVARTSAQILMAQGRKEGLKEGRQEGKQEGRLEGKQEGLHEGKIAGRKEGLEEGRIVMLLAQMEFKFGTLSGEQKEKVKHLSSLETETVGLRLLNAQTWSDLELN